MRPAKIAFSLIFMGSALGCAHFAMASRTAPTVIPYDKHWNFKKSDQYLTNRKNDQGVEPELVPREAWANLPPKPDIDPQALDQIESILVHNTETPSEDPNALTQILKDHIEGNGWKDVGYHFLIYFDHKDRRWKTYEGRAITQMGAHGGKLNDKDGNIVNGPDGQPVDLSLHTLGVVIVGTYAYETANKIAEVTKRLPATLAAGSPEAKKWIKDELAKYPRLHDDEYLKQPPREAMQQLVRVMDRLVFRSGLTGLKRIRGHGALSYLEEHPHAGEPELFGFAANPYHTDCPGQGMTHVVRALQKRYGLQ